MQNDPIDHTGPPPEVDGLPRGEAARSHPPVLFNGERFRVYLTADRIAERVRELGQELSGEYAGRRPVLVGVLNGAFMFLADLMRSMTIECEVDFIKLSSYGDSKITSGVVRELKSIDADIEGRDVVVVEDIVDTGLSMQYLVGRLQGYAPASIRTIALLHKHEATPPGLKIDYVGFRIQNLFVVGYGLDYGQAGRNLAHIYIQDSGPDA